MHEPEMYRLKYIHMYSYTGKSKNSILLKKAKGKEGENQIQRQWDLVMIHMTISSS